MAEEPTPPPAEEQSEQDEEDVYPFIDAAAGGGPAITVRAGWADQESGDPVELVINYSGSAGSPTSLATFEAALEWYRDTVSALVRAKQQEEQ